MVAFCLLWIVVNDPSRVLELALDSVTLQGIEP